MKKIDKLVKFVKNKTINTLVAIIFGLSIIIIAYFDMNYSKEISMKISIPLFWIDGITIGIYLVLFTLIRIYTTKEEQLKQKNDKGFKLPKYKGPPPPIKVGVYQPNIDNTTTPPKKDEFIAIHTGDNTLKIERQYNPNCTKISIYSGRDDIRLEIYLVRSDVVKIINYLVENIK